MGSSVLRNLVLRNDQDQSDQENLLTTQSSSKKKRDADSDQATSLNESTPSSPSPGGSIGSLLMQMQKQQEELQSKTGAGKEIETIVLDAGNITAGDEATTRTKSKSIPKEKTKAQTKRNEEEKGAVSSSPYNQGYEPPPKQSLGSMDSAAARELDDAVTWMVSTPSSRPDQLDSVQLRPLPSLYASSPAYATPGMPQKNDATTNQTTVNKEKRLTPLRMPSQYFDRISRDMRHLAVSIASSIENVEQWRTFCQEGNGGLVPLLECIREGARYISLQKQQLKQLPNKKAFVFLEQKQHEETIMAACTACRALRDLCAVSPELSAVITDGILRANAAYSTTTTSTRHRSELFNIQEEDDDGKSSTHNRRTHQTGNNLMHDFMTMLRFANEYSEPTERKSSNNPFKRNRSRRDARLRCKLYVTQLLLAMTIASDDAVEAIRDTEGLPETILECSSYSRGEQTRRWLRYPGEIMKFLWRSNKKKAAASVGQDIEDQAADEANEKVIRPFMQAAAIQNNLDGQVRRTANQVLAAIGYNRWVPKIPGQRGLRMLVLDGGGSRGMVAVSLVKGLVEAVGGVEVADSFDIIAGTSTGGIISFLTGLRREPSNLAVDRYNQLIKQIFVKSSLSTPMMLFTTATYDESHFMDILSDILGDDIMLDSRADPAVPYVFCVASKMSSTPTHVALFRNYNYAGGELADPFTIDPDKARLKLDLPLDLEHELIRNSSYERQREVRPSSGYKIEGSRHPGSFRVLQRYALRASTAAPTVFKPVMMGGEMYCDGGIVASNPSAVAVHEARCIFPDIPIELVVSIGTGGFLEQKNSPRIGWDGIIGQIVNSATDAEQIHHVLEDILGEGSENSIRRGGSHVSRTRYFRLNPTLGLADEFPIDVTEPAKLNRLKEIAAEYLAEPAQQRKLEEIGDILKGRRGWRKWLP